ncbi:MAG: right-handed parallel beta-helix repeat-containing protein [Verrucomicrobiota bacterium]
MQDSVFIFGALLVASVATYGEIIGVETFHYPDGAIAGGDGGTLWDYDNLPDPPGSPDIGHTGTASAWLNQIGAPVVTNQKLVTQNSSVRRDYNGAGIRQGAVNDPFSFPSSDANQVYIRVTLTLGETPATEYGFNSYDFGAPRLFFGKENGLTLGIKDINTSINYTGGAVPVGGQTLTLVGKIDYANDVATLYIDPDLNEPESAATAARSFAYTGTNWSTGVELTSTGGDPVVWDNLVVATTWEELGTVVTTPADEDDGSLGDGEGVSLREAVLYSPSGSLVTFAPDMAGETCTLTSGELSIQGVLTIDGSDLLPGATISGNRQSRIFSVSDGDLLMLSSLTLTRGNAEFPGGGGILLGGSGEARLTRCTIHDCSAIDGGGIVVGENATCIFEASTIADCHSTGFVSAGAIVIAQDSRMEIRRSTISGNVSAGSEGGIYLGDSAVLILEDSVVAGNRGAGSSDDIFNDGATVTPLGSNFIGNNSGVDVEFPEGPLVGTEENPKDPLLSPLAWFGGPTMTLHPLEGSPLIHAVTSTAAAFDQRGFPRVVGASADIGAVEVGPTITVTTELDEDDGFLGGAGISLREAIAAADQPGHRILFSSARFPRPIRLTLGQLEILSTPGLFIDASARRGGVFLDGLSGFSGVTPTRHFNISADATVAMQNFTLGNGRAPDGQDDAGLFNDVDARGDSGGSVVNKGTLSLLQSLLFGNRAGDGGSYTGDNTGVLEVLGGESGDGGGAANFGNLLLSDCFLEDNWAGTEGLRETGVLLDMGDGGAIWNEAGTVQVRDTVIRDGRAKSGGAIYGENGTVQIVRSTLSDNRAKSGGAIRLSGSSLAYLDSCTVSENSADAGGGAVEVGSAAMMEIVHTTVTANQAGSLGGDGILNFGHLLLKDSIVAGNASDNNLENEGSLDLVGTNLTSGDPLLAPLADRGGQTPVHLPLPGSPAIDAATSDTASTDQRGFFRDASPDIGSVEYQGTADLALVWAEDFDEDGVAWGVENAVGTDPFVFDQMDPSAFALRSGGASFGLSAGLNASALPYTRLHVRRSTDLVDFSEIVFTWDGPTDSRTLIHPDFSDFSSPGSFFFTGNFADVLRSFFILEAELVEP